LKAAKRRKSRCVCLGFAWLADRSCGDAGDSRPQHAIYVLDPNAVAALIEPAASAVK
jgi:hypothetical protein